MDTHKRALRYFKKKVFLPYDGGMVFGRGRERGKVIKLEFDVVTYIHTPLSRQCRFTHQLEIFTSPADESQDLSSCDSNADESPDEGVKEYGDKSKGAGGGDDPIELDFDTPAIAEW